METFFVPVIIFLLTLVAYAGFLVRNRKQFRHLAPGSMGWPYIGETLQLYSQHPNVFFSTRQKRHGEIFKTHILGCPCVMLASPDAARFVLVTQSNLFRPTYPKSKENLIGTSALFFHQGEYHMRLRKLVQGALYPDTLRRLVPGIEALTVSALTSWADGRVVNTYSELKMLSFEVGILAILGHLETHYKKELKKNYCILDRGYNSFPTDLPGTRYRQAVKARKKLGEILSSITKEKREKKAAKMTMEKDLLNCLLESKDDKGQEALSDEQIVDNIIGVLFAAQDTTASAMTWIVKYLHDNPKLLQAVKAEQKAVYQVNGNRNLTWNQTRNMPVTSKVILESLRMASIISFTFREAVTDVEYKGYVIPKGWKVMPLFRNIHHNPDFFPDPQNFDPARFESSLKPNTFMPFGSGVHACPGNELAKLEMLILVHHLLSHFRCELVGSESGIQYGPFPVPLHGLPARFWKEEE